MKEIQEALDRVRTIVEEVVRKEQHRNDVTQLPNERALNLFMEEAIHKGEAFWCALVEIDHFKRLNKRFTYELADKMLHAVGRELQNGEAKFFPRAKAFHLHGDEFYLAAVGDQGDVRASLDTLRDGRRAPARRADGGDGHDDNA